MNPQVIAVFAAVALACAFIGWKVWQTVRVARGEKACNSCGCDKDKAAQPQAH